MTGYLTERDLATIRALWREYVWAVGKVGLPVLWSFGLAGIHYRESGLRADAPGEPGGPFCLDPAGEGDQKNAIVEYAHGICKKYSHNATDLSLERDFSTAALVAAHELKGKANRPITDDWPAIGLAVARYNGFPRCYNERWQTGQGSEAPSVLFHPYASNDPANGRHLFRIGSLLKPDGSTVYLEKAPDRNAGAMIIARELRDRWNQWYRLGDEIGGGLITEVGG
jgi:hypothetical protein